MARRLATLSSSLVLVLATAAPAAGQIRELTLDRAIEQALEHSPDLRMGLADVDKARAEKAAAGLQIGPRLSLEAGIQYWDDETAVTFVDPAALPSPEEMAAFPDFLKGLLTNFSKPMKVMDRLTGSVTVQAVQPITPLWSLVRVREAMAQGERAAELSQETVRETVRFRVAEAFFRVLMVQRMAEVAARGVETVEAHLATARRFSEAGYVGREDVLRAETMLLRVKDQLNQAQAGIALARAALNVQIGLPASEPTQPVGTYPDPPPAFETTEEACLQAALQRRGELASLRARVEMAAAGADAATGTLIPTVAAVARYSHQEGSKFQRDDSVFVGGVLQWNFWDLGASWYKAKSAAADERKAREAVSLVVDGVTLDVKKAWLDLRTARSSLDANAKAIESAEETLRVVSRKYEVQTATSVEVLDAQTSVTQARAAYQVALFGCYTALANLRRAMGGDL
jgi:outer membrane protein TolC